MVPILMSFLIHLNGLLDRYASAYAHIEFIIRLVCQFLYQQKNIDQRVLIKTNIVKKVKHKIISNKIDSHKHIQGTATQIIQ